MNYYNKYIKYKNKYLKLLNQTGGYIDNFDELLIYKNNMIVEHQKNKKPIKKFNPNYLSKAYTPYKDDKHTIQSITKSILSLLFGIAIQNKHFDIEILDENIYNYFNNYQYNLSKTIKIKHLLTMSSGIKWNTNYDDPNNTTFTMESSKDWIVFILEQSMEDDAGIVFHYKDCDTVLLGYIFEKLVKMNVDDYANKYLWKLLDIDVFWNKINDKADVEGGLYLSSYSLLKIGQLVLNNGLYKGKQIISKPYIKMMIKNHKTNKDFFGYGFQWWLYKKIIFGWGYRGQYLVIIPSKKTIGIMFQWNNKKTIEPYEFIKML